MAEYAGPERRKGYVDLETALEKVEQLHGAVTTLATAVTNTVPRQELEDLKTEVQKEFKQKILINAALSGIIVLMLALFINYKLNSVEGDIKKGHDVITCLQGKTEAQRTGDNGPTALLLCTQTQKG